jgi:hypothetical protein
VNARGNCSRRPFLTSSIFDSRHRTKSFPAVGHHHFAVFGDAALIEGRWIVNNVESRPGDRRVELATLVNEFAAVRVSLDRFGHDPRLLVEDIETGDEILLSPIELASLCLASAEDRLNWLRVGPYRDERAP